MPAVAGEDRVEQVAFLLQDVVDVLLDRLQHQKPRDRHRTGGPMRWPRLIA